MFNNQPQNTGSVVAPVPAQPFGPGVPGSVPLQPRPANSRPVEPKKSKAPLILGILLALAVIAIGVLLWLYITLNAKYLSVSSNVQAQIDVEVAQAISKNTTKMEEEFADRERYPYRTFAGPADFGSLTFKYPKTWSVYIDKDGSAAGSEFAAFLNPVEVYSINNNTSINALRVNIRTASFESAVQNYDNQVTSGKLTLNIRNIGSASANVYAGEFSEGLRGVVAIFRIRDKVVTLQTDAELFSGEFNNILDSVTFAE